MRIIIPIICTLMLLISDISYSQSDRFYYYKGEKINLDINEDMFYVLMSDTVDISEFFIRSDFKIKIKKNGYSKYKDKKHFWNIIQITDKEKDKTNKVKDWPNNNPNIKWIGPVIGNDYPTAVSEYFYVKLKDNNDYSLLVNIAEETSCEIISALNFMPLWYKLKVSTNSDILDVSNYFYSSNYFQDVDPGFVFDFSRNCISDDEFDDQWGLTGTYGIDACNAWEITRGSPCIAVAVVDQGIDNNHNEFTNNLLAFSYDAEDDSSPAQLYDFHGTHVAGIIGANQNGSQISGVAPLTSLMAISHSLGISSTMSEELAEGISVAWQNGADIINNSWGDYGGDYFSYLHSTALEDAIDDALESGRNGLGCVVIFSSGNEAPALDYPASYTPDILCVGSNTSSGSRSSFSGYGTELDVVAPGSSILSTLPNNDTGEKSGTSMAAPHVSGIAALLLSANPSLTQDQVRYAIESTCDKIGTYSYSTTNGRHDIWNQYVGYGKVNAYKALISVY